jgi:seryl-tRNA synthetase
MNHEKNWVHEMGPEEEKKINDKVVEQGISDMPRSEPLEMIKKLSLEDTKFKRENPELVKEVEKTFLDNKLENIEPKLMKLQYKWEKVYTIKEEVDNDLKKYFGDDNTSNIELSFKNEQDEKEYKRLKQEQSDLMDELKDINIKIEELIHHKLN